MVRKPNARQRRRELCDAAIRLLANEGAKGLSHLKVDREAGVPDGGASFYFRTRSALLMAVAQRLAELDHAALVWALRLIGQESETGSAETPSKLAVLMITAAQEPHLTRTKARYELMLQASRDPALAAVFAPNIELFGRVHRAIVSQLQPPGVEADDALLNDQIAATAAFINGVGLQLAVGDRSIHDAEQIDRLLTAIINGVIVAHHRDTTGNYPSGGWAVG
jgi:DNA-binding transcriptional regulator YbjK